MKILYIILITLLFSPVFAQAQTTISGKVTDQDGAPLESASVFLQDTDFGTVSDEKGQYIIDNVADGDYTFVVTFLGYSEYRKKVSASGSDITINAKLVLSYEQYQVVEIIGRRFTDYKPDVTFAGTKTGLDIKDVPQSISILNKEIIADQGLFRLEEITENIAGVTRVRDADGFMSRGFRLSHDYINGNRALIATDFASSTIATHYERIEVIKGPAAALFGHSSPGGVVNAVTKKPLKEDRATASLSTGGFNAKRATADLTGPINDDKSLLYRLNFAWEDAGTFRDFQNYNVILFVPSLSYFPTENTSFNFDIVGTFNNDRAGVDRGMPVLQGDIYALPISFNTAERYDYRLNSNTLVTLSGSHRFSDQYSVNVSYTRSDFDQNFLETRSANQFTTDGTELIRSILDRITKGNSNFITAYLVGRFKTGNVSHEAVVGYDYFEISQDSRTRSAQGEANGVPNLKFNNRVVYDNLSDLLINFSEVQTTFATQSSYHGFYIQDLIGVGSFKFLLGLRYEDLDQSPFFGDAVKLKDDIDNTVLLPRLGITYHINDNVNVFGSYTESFDEQSIPPGTNSVDTGKVYDPLSSNQIEFGAKSSFFDDKLLAQVSLYFINRSGRLIEDPASGGGFIRLLQVGDETSRGIELDITGRISSNFTLTANYAYNHVDILDDDLAITSLELENNNPKHTTGFWGKYSFSHGLLNNFAIGIGGRYVSESQIVDTTPQRLEDKIFFERYFTARAALYYKIDHFNLSFNLNNVFDERYFVGGLNAGRIFPGEPRNYLVTLGYKF